MRATAVEQRTLAKPVSLSGIGLHTGTKVTLTFAPAPPDTGYTIVRKDLPGEPRIRPRAELVSQSQRGTAIRENGVEVHTIEHVLAALAGLEIDNCLIELTAHEPPIMDGSALPFVAVLQEAGTQVQPGHPRKVFQVAHPVHAQGVDKGIAAEPHPGLRITYELDYGHPQVAPQSVTLDITPEVFSGLLAPSRTFCFEHEIEGLKSQGLAKGGSLENALVLNECGLKNPPFRFDNELVYHKILDIVGDLALLGCRVEGYFKARRTGHELNVLLVKKLQKQTGYFERGNSQVIIDAKEIEQLLPHRYPMLLVDRIIDLEPGQRVVGIKNVTMNEHFFQGHFPGHPIMPGVLIVEAMAQCGGVLLMKSAEDARGKVVYFASIDNVKFRKPVLPGDQLRLEVVVEKLRSKIAKMHAKAFVGEDLVCEADLMSTLSDR